MNNSVNRLYRCRVKCLYKFFNTNLGVVFDEKYIQDLSINLGWDANLASMNSETTESGNGVMSFTGSGNYCSITITDPFFTGITFPSLLDVAGAAIGSRSYQSGQADGEQGILRRKCNEGENPAENDCWDYELIDLDNWIPTNNANAQVSNTKSQYSQAAMIMISLYYEAYNGFTFGTDYLFRVSGSSASHGKEFPSVTLSGQGAFGITFQDRLVNVSIDNELEVEKALAELAARNDFNMEFCVADYDDPQKLKRRVLKSNLTIKQLLDDIVKNKSGGNYLSLPTKDMYNTLHVCTRADTWPGCSVFYLGRPLYEGFKVSAIIDSTMVGRNLEFGDNIDGTSRADNGSGYLPGFDQADSAWEVILPTEKNIHQIKSATYSNKTLNVEFRDSATSKPIRGTWEGFKDKRDQYFTKYNEKLIILEKKTDKVLQKKNYEKVNPGYIGEFEDQAASVVLSGKVTEMNDVAESDSASPAKSISVKTDFVIYLRGLTSNLVTKLDIFADLSLFEADQDVKKGYEVPLGGVLGKTAKSKKQNLSYYGIIQNSKVFIDPMVVYTMSSPATYDPGVPNTPPSGVPVSEETQALEGAAQSKFEPTKEITPSVLKAIPSSALVSLQNLIASGEGGVESINVIIRDSEGVRTRGTASTFKTQFGKTAAYTTLSEIRARQQQRGTVNGLKEIGAVGYPQFIGDTLGKAIQYTGISTSTKFSRQTQDELLKYLLFVKRPEIGAFLVGASGSTKSEAAQGLAREFASFSLVYAEAPGPQLRASGTDPKTTRMQDPDKKRPAGSSLYAGVAGNKAKISASKAQSVLEATAKTLKGAGISTSTVNYRARANGTGADDGEGEETTEETTTATEATPQPESAPLLKFKWPMSGQITSHKGQRSGRLHRGIDIQSPGMGGKKTAGAPVYAAAPGVVERSEFRNNGYGNQVIINHGNNYKTLYAHFHSIPLVKVGESVSYNTQLGVEGNTGNSEATHLHFEILFDGNPVSPDATHTGKTSKGKLYNVTKGSDTNLYQPSNGVRVNVDGLTISPGGQSNANSGQSAPGGGTGFNIDTEFKGVPRALRILPKFTILSFVGKYQAWLESNRQIGIDPGVWLPDYFRNWLIKTVQFNWSQGDLRVKINASSVFGIDNRGIVPTWDSYSDDLASNGKYSDYVDYIRAYGDLCWNDNGRPSCHTRCAVTEAAMLAGLRDNQRISSADVSSLEGCQLEPGKLNLSSADMEILRRISMAEARGEGTVGQALVVRAIFNRKLIIEKGASNDYYTKGKSDIRSIVFATPNQFQPVINGAYEAVSPSEFPQADKAIRLAFDTEALLKQGVSKYKLTASNFRATSASAESNWVNGGEKYKGHLFGRDNVQNRILSIDQHLSSFSERYGKCTKTGGTTSAIGGCVSPPSGGWKYSSNKASTQDNWIAKVSRTEKTNKIALALGHWNTRKEEEGATGERAFLPTVGTAIVSLLKSSGYDVAYLQPSQSDKMDIIKVYEWLAQKNNEGYYATELHFDALTSEGGKSGVIPAQKNISVYDVNLAKEFGAFDYKHRNILAGPKRNVSLLELGSVDLFLNKSDEIQKELAKELATRFVSALSC